MMTLPAFLVFSVCSLGGSWASYLPLSRLPLVYVYQQQREYLPENVQNYDNGFAYHQAYKNSYHQNLQYNGLPQYNYPESYVQFTASRQALEPQILPVSNQDLLQLTQQPQEIPEDVPSQTGFQQPIQEDVPSQTGFQQPIQQEIPSQTGFQQPIQQEMPSQTGVQQPLQQELPQQLEVVKQSQPAYQLIPMGPQVPVLIRLPNHKTTILPARSVYSLPGFLESMVQNVQNYYSVFNPLEGPDGHRNKPTFFFQPNFVPSAETSTSVPKPQPSTETAVTTETPAEQKKLTEVAKTEKSETSNTEVPEVSNTEVPEVSNSEVSSSDVPEVSNTDVPEVSNTETTTEVSTEASPAE